MIVETFNHPELKAEFIEFQLQARGVVAVHTGCGKWVAESTMTFSEKDCDNIPYTVVPGETFNVMFLPVPGHDHFYLLQPQTARNILIPFDLGEFAAGVIHYATSDDRKEGIDVLKWLDDDELELVQIQ